MLTFVPLIGAMQHARGRLICPYWPYISSGLQLQNPDPKNRRTNTAESITGVIGHWEGTITHAKEVNGCKNDVCMKAMTNIRTY